MKKMNSLKEWLNSITWRPSPNEQEKGRTILGTNWFRDELNQVTKGWCIIAPIERYSGYRYIQWKKKVSQSSMPWFCSFSYAVVNYIFECYRNTYLSERNEFNRVYFLRFCSKYETWFSKYRIELLVALSSTNATNSKSLAESWRRMLLDIQRLYQQHRLSASVTCRYLLQ